MPPSIAADHVAQLGRERRSALLVCDVSLALALGCDNNGFRRDRRTRMRDGPSLPHRCDVKHGEEKGNEQKARVEPGTHRVELCHPSLHLTPAHMSREHRSWMQDWSPSLPLTMRELCSLPQPETKAATAPAIPACRCRAALRGAPNKPASSTGSP